MDGTFRPLPDDERASEIEVTFTPEPGGGTRVELAHTRLDKLGDSDGERIFKALDGPSPGETLARFAEAGVMAVAHTVAGPGLLEIADGVYAREQLPGGWCLNNAGLVAGGGRAVLVDTAATRARARHLAAAVDAVAPGGPDVVVNTHFHGDHVFGNVEFAPRATVVAHEQTRSDVAESGHGLCRLWPTVDWGDIPLVLPDVTFEDELTFHAGDLTVHLLHVGPAHTPGDVVAWVPERKVLFARGRRVVPGHAVRPDGLGARLSGGPGAPARSPARGGGRRARTGVRHRGTGRHRGVPPPPRRRRPGGAARRPHPARRRTGG
uniref:Cyclase n=1 Tax=Streptomyces griseoruber TaxID=1943 RepID=Q67G29_9ACTN|nr:cyclase [Streptomyces griseoruber]